MPRLLLVFLCLAIAANLGAQSPAHPSATASPSATPPPATPTPTQSTESIINSMGPADLQQAVQLLQTNYIKPDALNETELNRAMLTGLLARLTGGVLLLSERPPDTSEATHPFHGELLDGHIGYLRPGALTTANLTAMDGAMQSLNGKKLDAVVLDL